MPCVPKPIAFDNQKLKAKEEGELIVNPSDNVRVFAERVFVPSYLLGCVSVPLSFP